MPYKTSALAMMIAMAAPAAMAQDIVSLDTYSYDDLYSSGMSARNLIESMDAYDRTGEEVGEVEDFIVNRDGSIAAVVAEIGGFLDIGDTHVAVPWDEVEMTADGLLPAGERR